MYTSPTLTNANIKSIILNTIIKTCLRFPLKEILRYNFDKNHIMFIEIQARFTKLFLRKTTDNPLMVKSIKN